MTAFPQLRRLLLVLLIALLAVSISSAQETGPEGIPGYNTHAGEAQTFVVNSFDDTLDYDLNDDLCLDNPIDQGGKCTLRAAIGQANSTPAEDIIKLPAGTYTITLRDPDSYQDLDPVKIANLNRGGDFDIINDLIIEPVEAETTAEEVIIDANMEDGQVFDIGPDIAVDMTVTFRRLTIQGGDTHVHWGGGIRAAGSSLHTLNLEESIVKGNKGAGIGMVFSTVNVISSTIEENERGGIYNQGGVLNVSDGSKIRANTGLAGIYAIRNASPKVFPTTNIDDSEITENRVPDTADGGGIYIKDGWVNLNNSIVALNRARNGGGIYLRISGTKDYNYGLWMDNSTIANNLAVEDGGGIMNFVGTITVTNSTINNNRALNNGGGISTRYNSRIRNTTLSGNYAASDGGGLHFLGTHKTYSHVELSNLSIIENEALRGGGISIDTLISPFATLRIANSLIAANRINSVGFDCYTDVSGAAVITSEGHNIVSRDDDCPFDAPTDIIDSATMVGSLQDNGGPTCTHALTDENGVASNPAIDGGNTSSSGTMPIPLNECTTTDQRGINRSGACDVGAFEYITPSAPATGIECVFAEPPVGVADAYTTGYNTVYTESDPEKGLLQNDQSFIESGVLVVDSSSTGVKNTDQGGKIEIFEDGTFVYTPPTDYVGGDYYRYYNSDGFQMSTGIDINLVVREPPSVQDDEYATAFDVPLTVPAPGVLANDTPAVVGQSIEVNPITDGQTTAKGTYSIQPDGSFTYTPNAGYTGTDTFTYTVTDGETEESDIATVSIIVAPEGAITAVADSYTGFKDDSLTVPAPGVLANDLAPEGKTIVAVENDGTTQKGNSWNLAADGSFVFRPKTGFTGTDEFTYTAQDQNDPTNTSEATVTITVPEDSERVNAEADTYSTPSEVPLTVADYANGVLANDTGPEGSTLQAVAISGGSTQKGGTYTLNADGTFSYTPPTGYSEGTDTFEYTLTDGVSTDKAIVTITIIGASAGPAGLTTSGDMATAPVHPTFSWTGPEGATWYNLYVTDAAGSVVVNEWFPATNADGQQYSMTGICTGTTCSTQATTVDSWGMTDGTYSWWVGAYLSDTTLVYSGGAEFAAAEFTVNVGASALNAGTVSASVVNGNVVLTWPDDGATMWAQVWVGDGPFGPYLEWHGRDLAEGKSFSCVGGTCTLMTSYTGIAGTPFTVYMQGWGPGGFSTGTVTAAPTWFEVPVTGTMPTTPPPAVTDGQLVGTASAPDFEWTAVANGTWYQVILGTADGSWNHTVGWYYGTELGCVNAGDTCTLPYPWGETPLPNGNYVLHVGVWGPGASAIVYNAASEIDIQP